MALISSSEASPATILKDKMSFKMINQRRSLMEEKLEEDLNLFSTGSFYDCTFKVSNDDSSETKLFRCHKVFLASCSEPFGKLLCGSFKEGNVDRDFEICITKTSPLVFDLAMRFVYARSNDFKSPETAVQVYFFAKEWMILTLLRAVESYLSIIKPEDALEVLKYFVDEENYITLTCWQVVKDSTAQVLSCKSWREASEDVMLKVLQMQSMKISEALLFDYLVVWGRCNYNGEANVRATIEKGIKFIRFCTMSCAAFSTLCCKPRNPLTEEERYKIFLSITQKNEKLLPSGFSNSKTPRCLGETYVYEWENSFKEIDFYIVSITEPFTFTLAMDQQCFLTGVKFVSLQGASNAGQVVQLTCKVFSAEHPSICIAVLTNSKLVQAGDSGELKFPWPVMMRKDVFFTFKVTYKQVIKEATAFHNKRSFFWNTSVPGEKVGIIFANDVHRIVDVCGLLLAKSLV